MLLTLPSLRIHEISDGVRVRRVLESDQRKTRTIPLFRMSIHMIARCGKDLIGWTLKCVKTEYLNYGKTLPSKTD
jgi:hypothetical protein